MRAPLNAIVGWVEILRNHRGGSNKLSDFTEGLSVIDRNVKAQKQIIEDILDMSRVVSGKLRLDFQRVNLSALVQAGVDTVQLAAVAKGGDWKWYSIRRPVRLAANPIGCSRSSRIYSPTR